MAVNANIAFHGKLNHGLTLIVNCTSTQVLGSASDALSIRIPAATIDRSSPNWFFARRVRSPQSRFQKQSSVGDLFRYCIRFRFPVG